MYEEQHRRDNLDVKRRAVRRSVQCWSLYGTSQQDQANVATNSDVLSRIYVEKSTKAGIYQLPTVYWTFLHLYNSTINTL